MKGIVYVAALCSAMLISGCVTTKEIVVGVDANGNEILRNVEGINYDKLLTIVLTWQCVISNIKK